MRKILSSLAVLSVAAFAAASVAAQTTAPDPSKKEPAAKGAPPVAKEAPKTAPPATPPPAADATKDTPPAVAKTGPDTAEKLQNKRRATRGKHRRHARTVRRHRLARHRVRNVWVYRAHGRAHGHYQPGLQYVRRSFGGYFARGREDCGCRHQPRLQHAQHWSR